MTIEQLALKAYPVRYGSIGDEKEWDMNEQYRECWIQGYKQALSLSAVVGRSEQFICPNCKKHTEEWLDGICEDCTLKGFTEGK